jgi:predicted HTH transcriptional regulator
MLSKYLTTDALFRRFFDVIVNAIARHYDSTASVQVMLFRDRMEVWMPPQLSIETLKNNHGSFLHKPLIADAFIYYAHFIERMGSNVEDMVEKCLNLGLSEPEFKIKDGFVSIIYRKQGIAYEKVKQESDTVTEQVNSIIESNNIESINHVFHVFFY